MGQYCLCRRYNQYWLSSSLYCMHIVQCVHITQHLDKKCSFNINFGNTLALMKIMPLTLAMYMFLLLLKTLLNVIEEQYRVLWASLLPDNWNYPQSKLSDNWNYPQLNPRLAGGPVFWERWNYPQLKSKLVAGPAFWALATLIINTKNRLITDNWITENCNYPQLKLLSKPCSDHWQQRSYQYWLVKKIYEQRRVILTKITN